jgi:hypothetical protein
MKAISKIVPKAVSPTEIYTVRHRIYDPLESHPDWYNITGTEDSMYWLEGDIIHAKYTPDPPDQLIAYGTDSPTNARLSGMMMAAPAGLNSELYLLVGRMIGFNNFVGFTMWNDDLRVYDRVDGSWDMPIMDTITPLEALGRVVTMEIIANTVTLTVEGVNSWSGSVQYITPGRVGMLSRGWNLPPAPVIKNFTAEVL